jgi:hypothetical protein
VLMMKQLLVRIRLIEDDDRKERKDCEDSGEAVALIMVYNK